MTKNSSILNTKLIQFRKNIIKNRKKIINSILNKEINNICIFCGANQHISKEHVIPRWLFDKNPEDFFIETLNNFKKKYQRTVVPACKTCNSNILAYLEDYILANLKFPYDPDDLNVIILWLEIIDYKFIVHDFNTQFVKNFETKIDIQYLRNFSLMELKEDFPWKTLTQSLNRLTVKKKDKRINSFVFFKSKNPIKGIIHSNNNFIMIESPKLKCAVFYFLKESFDTEEESAMKALSIIEKNYK